MNSDKHASSDRDRAPRGGYNLATRLKSAEDTRRE